MGLEEDVAAREVLPDECRPVELLYDIGIADVSDVRLDLGVDFELVAVDFRVRCDVFVAEGELIGTVRPRCAGSAHIVTVLGARY